MALGLFSGTDFGDVFCSVFWGALGGCGVSWGCGEGCAFGGDDGVADVSGSGRC